MVYESRSHFSLAHRKSAKFSLGGTTPYADVLWTNPLIGDFSRKDSQIPGTQVIPKLHGFTYDIYFYSSSFELSRSSNSTLTNTSTT